MLPLIVFAVAAASWFVSLVGVIGMLCNLSGRKTAMEVLSNGLQLYVAANFTETGLKWRRVYFAGVVGFAAPVVALMAFAR
jgi:hypothetical protein